MPGTQDRAAALEMVTMIADEEFMKIQLMIPSSANSVLFTEELLLDYLQSRGIVHGIQPQGLAQLVQGLRDVPVVVALGTPPILGTHGDFCEMFSREVERALVHRPNGTVDHKQLNLIRDINRGTAIYLITPPTCGQAGRDTRGQSIPAPDGRQALPPLGAGTCYSENGLQVEAATCGNLVFEDGKFHVRTQYEVHNVDFTTGNIVFSGDVLVRGDVKAGFEIRAGGNVTIQGQLETSTHVSGADIHVPNGFAAATVQATGCLRTSFIENAVVEAGRELMADSIVNSQIECDGDVKGLSQDLVILGGVLTVRGSICASQIGNETQARTTVVMGIAPGLLRQRSQLHQRLKAWKIKKQEVDKNLEYLRDLQERGTALSMERQQARKRMQVQQIILKRRICKGENRIEQMEQELEKTNHSVLKVHRIYPPTKLALGHAGIDIENPLTDARIYMSETGDIVVECASA